jgi:hypothetical protein
MLLEAPIDIVRVAGATDSPSFKLYRLAMADKAAMLIALIIAAAALFFWLLGIVGLWGSPQSRFDHAMIVWTAEAELALVLPIWLFLRVMEIVVGVTNRWLLASRYGVRRQAERQTARTEA